MLDSQADTSTSAAYLHLYESALLALHTGLKDLEQQIRKQAQYVFDSLFGEQAAVPAEVSPEIFRLIKSLAANASEKRPMRDVVDRIELVLRNLVYPAPSNLLCDIHRTANIDTNIGFDVGGSVYRGDVRLGVYHPNVSFREAEHLCRDEKYCVPSDIDILMRAYVSNGYQWVRRAINALRVKVYAEHGVLINEINLHPDYSPEIFYERTPMQTIIDAGGLQSFYDLCGRGVPHAQQEDNFF